MTLGEKQGGLSPEQQQVNYIQQQTLQNLMIPLQLDPNALSEASPQLPQQTEQQRQQQIQVNHIFSKASQNNYLADVAVSL